MLFQSQTSSSVASGAPFLQQLLRGLEARHQILLSAGVRRMRAKNPLTSPLGHPHEALEREHRRADAHPDRAPAPRRTRRAPSATSRTLQNNAGQTK